MPRQNSLSDSDGRSLTPDLEDEATRDIQPPSTPPPQSPRLRSAQSLRAPQSIRSPRSDHSHNTAPRPVVAPIARFRGAVRKIIQLHRSTRIIANRGIGAEPGIDPRRRSANQAYGHIKENCVIEVIDYSAVRTSVGRMTNGEFINLLADPGASRREPWAKVRWINVGGVSWDVISALTIKYDLHPLALEDVLHMRDQNRSKADYYTKHLFLRVLCHSLAEEDDFTPTFAPAFGSTLTGVPRSSSPVTFSEVERKIAGELDDEGTMFDDSNGITPHPSTSVRRRGGILKRRPFAKDLENGNHSKPSRVPEKPTGPAGRLAALDAARDAEQTARVKEEISIEELKKGQRIHVKVSPMYIFLLRDGTVISIQRTPHVNMTQPISARLSQRDTMLRTSADPSLLVQSLLDLIVDEAMEVIDAYQGTILRLEHDVLLKPKMKTVRHLHILSGDLILHKRTLEPIRTMIYGLRRYDTDRCAALIEGGADLSKVQGFMSHKSKIYLADVHDHMEYILTSLDMFTGIAENLINYTFNMASYQMNEVMRRLTLATIIFLPLTLLTGYFGMNFDNMWTIHHGHTDIVFWIIAIPVMLIVIPMFLYQDFDRMIHYLGKRWATNRAVRAFKGF